MTIGKRIREFRLAKEWTLADLSKASHVALSTLSRIETGKMTGTLASHIAVAKALGVRLPELYSQIDPTQEAVEVHRQTGPTQRLVTAQNIPLAMLTSGPFQKKMLPVLLNLPAHKSTPTERGPVGVEKFLFVMRGQLEGFFGKEKVTLKAGDSVYFQAANPHSVKNSGSTTAQLLVVSAPPTL